ncbi:hypothetical protein [Hymenobacter yonginensis]|uniref:ATP-binding protein n=1 Tax=Hymenobacter yonginensis TaxID=748197 RepID=A0ABY7PW32_9BACT|nr:hypothetical protein [Hymenobacter yonginensis]WBO86857.1 hypothetical protein O9Z63_20455 [Hymenobacter yonginensis]
MHEVEQAQLLNIQGRFLRSTHIERDWHDPVALQDYVVTQHAKQSTARLTAGLTPTSGLRAWRITGDYGSGKSSFALLLANILSHRRQQLPAALQAAIAPALQSVDAASLPLWPVLVTGSREPLGLAIVRGLHELLLALPEPPTKLVAKLHAAVAKGLVSDAQVIKWVQAVHALMLESGLAQGLLLVLDEVGKFLEFAALHPERQDIYLLQGLAELAARSGPAPLMIVVLMHQGISGYAENLTQTQQREWEKIAGRYEELSWHHPLEQVAELISSALNTDLTEAPRQASAHAKRDMQDALRLRWYGTASHQKSLLNIAARLYPLHPTVLPVLVRLFATFGQNERSLFSFLLGSEPFGLLDFVERTEGRDFFRIADLYDYARQAFNQRLSLQSFRNHWKAIDGIVSSYRGEEPLELGLLKTIGLLNVLNAEDLLATNEALELALRGSEDVKAAIQRLKAQHLLYYRGAAGGYSLWPHTSVNLDTVYSEATREIGSLQKVAGLVRDRLEVRPLVARRHYIRTGTLRFFEVVYVAVDTLADHMRAPLTADGRILVPLCETPEEEARALALVQTELTHSLAQVLIAVPQPLQGLAPVLAEVLRWEWIQRNVPELQHDGPARDETATQLALAQQRLAEHLQRYVGMTNATDESGLRWFRQGALLPTVKSGPEVMTLLTTVLDEVFHSAPLIHNELVNRKSPSSAAAAARGRLCEHLFETSSEPYLGMDATRTPPEMSMYLSVLKEAQLHVFNPEHQSWSLQLPAAEHDHLRILPAFQRIGEVLRASSDARVPATEVYAALQQAPYGVREGMIPLLLAIFSVINEQELAFYEDDTFIPRITGSNFFRLTKAPETFDIQFYPISGVRTGLFQSLIQHLKLSGKQPVRVDLLDVVKPLLTFVAGLPAYTLKTSRLAPQTKAVRALLMTARDPATLLFHALPEACDLPPILEESGEQDQTVEQFALALKTAIDELRGAHPALLHWIKERLQEEFLLHGTFEQVRQALAPRAASVAGFVTEPRLKSFCLRLADTNLSETMWLESLGNLVCAMPPAKWKDADVHKYEQEIHHLAAQFARVEAIVYNRSKFKGTVEGESVRIALTQPTGQERKKVIHLTPEEVKDANELQDVIAGLLRDKGLVGMAAASRALWQLLSATESTATETGQEIF